MTRYFFVILVMALIGVAIVVKAGITMFAERQYWQDVADRFVKENVTVKPNRGNIISSDGKLMASSLPEYRIYMDFMSGEKDEKRRKKDQARRDSILNANMDSICIGLNKIFPDKSVAQFKAHLKKGRQAKSRNYLIYPKRISYIQYKEVKRLPVFCLNRYKGGFKELAYNQRKKPFGSLAARTLGDVYADTAKGARNGIELAFDTILKGRNGLTHRQKVMNKYLNIVDVPPVDGCDLLTTIDVGMQDICEKALVDKLKELNASVGVVVLMEVATGEVKAIVNMMQGKDGEYYEMRNNAISDMLEPGSTFKTASIMVALEDGKITPDYVVDTGNGQMPMHGRVMKDHNWHRGGYGKLTVTEILGVSSNVGTSYIIDHFYGSNPQKFVDGLKRMSIDQPLHLQIAGEGKPNIRGPKERSYFSKTALPWMSIGYETQVPPMNIVTFYNAIANKGVMVRPKFVKAAIKDGEIVKEYPTEVIGQTTPGDDKAQITADILAFIDQGADMVICSGGMSVDPDDRTPGGIRDTGARVVTYGAPVLPGAMLLIAYYEKDGKRIPILGLPGCVMYAKRTVFDLVLPRIMADDEIFAEEVAAYGEGGLCLNCKVCTFPNCGFGK